MTKVRISNVSNLATARACAALNIDYIGLNLSHGKPNAISPIKVDDYVQWLSGITVVAQAHHLNETKAKKFMELLKLKHVEILAENYEDGDKSLWYFGNENNEATGTFVSKNASEKAFKLIENLNELKGNTTNVDLPIHLFEQEEGVDWDLVNSVIEKLKG